MKIWFVAENVDYINLGYIVLACFDSKAKAELYKKKITGLYISKDSQYRLIEMEINNGEFN